MAGPNWGSQTHCHRKCMHSLCKCLENSPNRYRFDHRFIHFARPLLLLEHQDSMLNSEAGHDVSLYHAAVSDQVLLVPLP
jgi:hypothetical protein